MSQSDGLTLKEMEVLRLVVCGHTNREIANQLIISVNTAKAHVRNITLKLAMKNRVQVAVYAVRYMGVIDGE